MLKVEKKYFPVMIDISKSKILIVGGGDVSFRKAMNVIDFGGEIVVVSPLLTPEFDELIARENIIWIQRKYESGDALGYGIVFCSTGDLEADRLVYDDCIKHSIPVNVADVPELCSFIMPAYIKRGKFTTTFSSQGIAPFYTKAKKEEIEKILRPSVGIIAEFAGLFREMVLSEPSFRESGLRKKLFNTFLDIDWEHIIETEGLKSAKARANDIIEDFKRGMN
jgi:precorrin-2 dehydrogenase/sirohydrochlorin ferrochelatase